MKTKVGAVGIIITTGIAISSCDSSSNSNSTVVDGLHSKSSK